VGVELARVRFFDLGPSPSADAGTIPTRRPGPPVGRDERERELSPRTRNGAQGRLSGRARKEVGLTGQLSSAAGSSPEPRAR
jgi:hypothetical protein